MEFGILGPLEVRCGSDVVSIRRGLPRTIMSLLIVRRGHTVASDFLIDVLWGEDPPRNPSNALQIQVSYLRKTLSDAEPRGSTLLETRAGGYTLAVEPNLIDAHRFEVCCRDFVAVTELRSEADLRVALKEAEEALALWRGDALEDVAELEFARGEITRLHELRWLAIERRVDLLLRLGRHADAVAELSDAVSRMPLRERLHEQLILALYRSGRQADALRAYGDARRTLVDELGIEPGTDLRDLERRILLQDPTLQWVAPERGVALASHDLDHTPPTTRVSRVPRPVSQLVGRDEHVSRLVQLLGGHRAVTLTGPAGAGKTRIAIEVATRSLVPVCYVDFSPIDDAALVAPTVAAAAGVTIAPGDDTVTAIADALAGRETLLVLDTCEHVVAAVAHLTSTVLRAAPRVRVLATSRRPLSVSGEFTWPVPPLDLPPPEAVTAKDITTHAAVALFIERATAVAPDLIVDDVTAAEIAAVCVALDGLPLAIELAAARTDLLSPAAIRARLEDRFGLLVDGDVDAAERQQTLRAAIDWSFELLTAPQRTFFARLGVFAGTFDLDAALKIAGHELDSPLELLGSLVKQSMVVRASQDRFRLLDTLRVYALEALADLDADATRDRHADAFVLLAEHGEVEIRGAHQLGWLDHLRSDLNNLRSALDWCLLTGDTGRAARLAGSLAWFWTLSGMLTEAIQHLERLIDVPDVPPPVRARCLWGYALLAASLGDLERARDTAYRACEVAAGHDDAGVAYGLNAAAVAEWALGHHERSVQAHRRAIGLLEESDDRWGLAVCNVLLARTMFDVGDPAADHIAATGVEHARRAGDRHVLGIALTQVAQISTAEGDAETAVSAAAEALALQEMIGYTEGIVSALHVLGSAERVRGDVRAARNHHRRALALAIQIGHAAAMCEAVEDLARDEASDDPDLAATLLHATRAERSRRQLPMRQRDEADLAALERSLANVRDTRATHRTFADLVAEIMS